MNPNRLVGSIVVVLLSLGALWWLHQERETRESTQVAGEHAGVLTLGPGAVPRPTHLAPHEASNTSSASPAHPLSQSVGGKAVVAEFHRWAEQYRDGDAETRRALMERGLELADLRKKEFEKLIQVDPRGAIREALPYSLRKSLPAAFDNSVERIVEGSGNLSVLGSTPKSDGALTTNPIRRWTELNGERFRTFVYGARLHQPTLQGVPLWGVVLGTGRDALMALSEQPARLLDSSEQADLLAAGQKPADPRCAISGNLSAAGHETAMARVGNRLMTLCQSGHAAILNQRFLEGFKRAISPSDPGKSNPTNLDPDQNISTTQGRFNVLFMRVAFIDDPREPISEDRTYSLMNDVNDYFRTASYNTVQLIPKVTPLLMAPQPRAYYETFGGPGELLNDARDAARKAGFDFEDYDLDILGHGNLNPPEFGYGGLAFVGARGAWVASFSAKVVAHELGHNLGLMHANASSAGVVPGPPQPRPPLPIDTDSAFGHHFVFANDRFIDDAVSQLFDTDYGDPNDWMGGGDQITGQFSALHKNLLNWLPNAYVKEVKTSGTQRVYAFDAPQLQAGRDYALKISKESGRKDFNRSYWLDHRQQLANNPWLARGVSVYWDQWEGTLGTAQLLDTTPGTRPGRTDSALVVGRTLSDFESNIHMTPIAKGGTDPDEWVDVVVQFGPFESNHPPSFHLSASAVFVQPNQPITFTAADVQDPDGDAVAFYWDFGNDTFGLNQDTVTKSFSEIGEYSVRCEVSDMKGGKHIAHVMVTVGSPTTLHISGIVHDLNGDPIPDARVAIFGSVPQVSFTDSDGRYTITGLTNTFVTNSAFAYGYEISPENFDNPSPLVDAVGADMNHLAFRIPRVKISPLASTGEFGGGGAGFRFTRTGGSTELPLAVNFQTFGTAVLDEDYTGISNSIIIIPAGTNQVDLPITAKNDDLPEGSEFVMVQLVLATNIERQFNYVTNLPTTNIIETVATAGQVTITNYFTNIVNQDFLLVGTNIWPYPGWETRSINGTATWFQTPPPYVIDLASARIIIADDDGAPRPKVSLVVLDSAALEGSRDDATILVQRDGSADGALTVTVKVEGTATSAFDYLPIATNIVFKSGEHVVPIVIRALDDLYVEGDEMVTVTLLPSSANPAAYDIDDTPATVVIVDNDLPWVTINAVQSTLIEGDPEQTAFVISRAGDLHDPLSVSYFLGGSATNGLDYTQLSGTIVIPADQDSVSLRLRALPDNSSEGIETVEVQLSANTAYNVGNPATASLRLYDQRFPVVNLVALGTNTLTEGGSLQLRLSRSGAFTNPLTINLAFGGIADRFADYSPIANQLTIPAGASNIVFSINAIDDPYPENVENVIVALVAGVGYRIGAADRVETQIDENDIGAKSMLEFLTSTRTVSESFGNDPYLIPIHFSAPPPDSTIPFVLEYRLISGSAKLGEDFDFTLHSMMSTGFITFVEPVPSDPGLIYYTALALQILDNTNTGPNKTLTIGLYHPTGFTFTNLSTNEIAAATNVITITNATGSITLTNIVPAITNIITNLVVAPDNLSLGPFQFHTVTILDDDYNLISVEAVTAFAQEEGQVPGRFVIRRQGATNLPVTVGFEITGTASPETDFLPFGSSATIPAGASEISIDVHPLDDQTPEPAETVRLRLTSAPGSTIDQAKRDAVVSIVDNDGTMQFVLPVYQVAESVGTYLVPVHRYGETTLPQRIDYVITPITATLGEDYVGTNGTLIFEAGEIEKTISLVISNDTLVEPDEFIQLRLQNPSGGAPLPGQSLATVIIKSDDTEFTFATNAFSVAETSATASISVRRLGATSGSASVTLTVTNGIAEAGADFGATNLVLQFADGETNRNFLVRVLDDSLPEGDETVLLTLTEPSEGTALGTNASSTLTILDDDCLIQFTSPTFSVQEFARTASISVQRIGGTINPVAVDFRSLDGTALSNQDYAPVSGSLTFLGNRTAVQTNGSGSLIFLPGETNLEIQIPILDDRLGEGNERFSVLLSRARVVGSVRLSNSVSLGTITNAAVDIIDDETPGAVDSAVAVGLEISSTVNTVALQPDGRLVFGGDFVEVNGLSLRHVARLGPDGSLDTGFNPGVGADGTVYSVVSQSDGKVLLGGSFSSVAGSQRRGLARLNIDGVLDSGFDVGAGAAGAIRAIAVQRDGLILVGGDFIRYQTTTKNRLARLTPDGQLDANFVSSVNDTVNAIALQSDGKIIIGGAFTQVNGTELNGIARLNTNGTLDATFQVGVGVDGSVLALAVHSDDTVIVGGLFDSIGGMPVVNLSRLATNGTVDASFGSVATPNFAVAAVGLHSSGKIYVGGAFTQLGDQPRNRFGRLRPDGTLDDTFVVGSGANGIVRALAVHPNSAVDIGGDFTSVNEVARERIARIHGDEGLTVAGVEFASAAYTVDEGVGQAIVTVRRTGDPNLSFSVNYSTGGPGSTASPGQDYTSTNGVLTFASGVSSATFSVSIIDDAIIEPNELVGLTLSGAPAGVDLSGRSTANIVIVDNESSVQMASAQVSTLENDGKAVIGIVRQGPNTTAASVRLRSFDGTAIGGQDFVPVDQTVSFASGVVSQNVEITLLNDTVREAPEMFNLRLSEPSNGLQLGLAEATVEIQDDDVDRIKLAATALVSDANSDGAIDAGEAVTLMIALLNTGSADSTNVTATLLATNGVLSPSAPQNYGRMTAGGAPTSRPFTFGNSGVQGGTITAVLQLSDGGRDLGFVFIPLALGRQSTSFDNPNTVVISDNGPGNPYPSTIVVSGLSGVATAIKVTLNGFSHQAPTDADILMVNPQGAATMLLSDAGGLTPVNNLTLVFDDSATSFPSALNALVSGTYHVTNYGRNDFLPAPAPLGPYTNTSILVPDSNPNGTWSLYVFDDTSGDDGRLLRGWSLSITTSGQISAVADAGITITGPVGPISLGQDITYTLRVVNNGPAPASGILVRDTLPNGATFISASGGATPVNGEITFSIPTLAVGASTSFEVLVRASAAGSLVNRATVSMEVMDIFSANDTASLTTTVVNSGDQVVVSIALVGNNVIITWPTSSPNATLESTTSLNGATWKKVDAAPTIVGANWSVTVPASEHASFYRLRQP